MLKKINQNTIVYILIQLEYIFKIKVYLQDIILLYSILLFN